MKCPNCGTVTTGDVCPACAISPAPENVAGYGSLPHGPVNLAAVLRALKNRASQQWGSYHKFVAGTSLEPGEQEIHRASLRGASAFAVDRQVPVTGQGLVILTDRRLMVRDETGRGMELPLADIQGAHVRREDTPRAGPGWYVAVAQVTASGDDLPREVRLICQDRSSCVALASRITAAVENHPH
jgi:hypothetical protein